MTATAHDRVGRRGRRTALAAAAAGLVFLAACGTSPSSSPDTTPATGDAATASTGNAPEYATELRPVVEELLASVKVPSAVVVVRSSTFGDATFRFGSLVLGGDDTPTTSDRYRIGSITKTMTATVILQLAHEGKLSLDDPIEREPSIRSLRNAAIETRSLPSSSASAQTSRAEAAARGDRFPAPGIGCG